MANRYWLLGSNYGFAGTHSEEKIDACEYLGYTEEEIEKMPEEELEKELYKFHYQNVIENVEAWVETI